MRDEPDIEMYFCVAELSPKPGTEEAREFGGGRAACWVNTLDAVEGRERIRALLANGAWVIEKIKDEKLVSREGYIATGESDGITYYEQALIDGEVCVNYTFPLHEKCE